MSKRMVDLKVEAGKVTSIDGYEVGGGSSEGNISVKLTNSDVVYNGSISTIAKPFWVQPNTAYQVGDVKSFEFDATFTSVAIDSNQIFVALSAGLKIPNQSYTQQYGDVTLRFISQYTDLTSTILDNSKYKVMAHYMLKYMVVKGGTTGADVTNLNTDFNATLSYAIYTFESPQA